MVEEKIIHYNDGVIIECINESKARVSIPMSFLGNIFNSKEENINPWEIIENRMEKDFNFKNIGGMRTKMEDKGQRIIFHVERKIIPIK